MTLTLYHHPFSRAANVIWMLEEIGRPYDLVHTDIMTGAQKAAPLVALNPMGKLPTLVDDGTVVTESAAIGLYLADRYSAGTLAPAIDQPSRGPYLRWSLFAPSVIEPNLTAKLYKWDYKPGQVGWGTHDEMLAAIAHAVTPGPFLLGEQFSMADVIFGGTLAFMLRFKMLEPRPAVSAYVERLQQRPAWQRAEARNQVIVKERGLGG